MPTLRCRSAIAPRGPAWLRAAAASIALFALLGIGHVLPALHFALVAHRVCSEHGELLHAAAAAPRPSAEAGSRSSVPELLAGEGVEHEHDHCRVLALPGQSGVASAAASREPPAAGALVARASPGERPAHACIALLLRAPKLPPPAA